MVNKISKVQIIWEEEGQMAGGPYDPASHQGGGSRCYFAIQCGTPGPSSSDMHMPDT
jgi:hypothetical protein